MAVTGPVSDFRHRAVLPFCQKQMPGKVQPDGMKIPHRTAIELTLEQELKVSWSCPGKLTDIQQAEIVHEAVIDQADGASDNGRLCSIASAVKQ